jgi:AcrR family transcriptional regulator/acyl-coenzyme A thioesterase PaaI-like protein
VDVGDKATGSGNHQNITIITAENGRVTGRISLPDDQCAKSVQLGVQIDFAGYLAAAAMNLSLATTRQAIEIGCHASIFGRSKTRELIAEAVLVHGGEATATWQIAIRDEQGILQSAITLTHILQDRASQENDSKAPSEIPVALSKTELGERITASDQSPTLVEKRREQIAAAACDVIARKGFGNATMREIADAAGMHVPTMYQYVSSKDEMLELVYYWTMASVRTDVADATAGYANAAQKLRATVRAVIDKGDRFRHRIGVLNRELKSLSPPARVRVLAEYRKLLRQIADLIEEGIASGEFRAVEPVIAANFVEAVCDIWPLRQFAVGQFGLIRFEEEIVELLLASLRP